MERRGEKKAYRFEGPKALLLLHLGSYCLSDFLKQMLDNTPEPADQMHGRMHCLPCAVGYCKCRSDLYTHLRMPGMDVGCATWLDCAECGRPSRSNQGLASISNVLDMGADMYDGTPHPACICRLLFFILFRSTLLIPGRHRRCSPSCGGTREAVGRKSEQTSNLRVISFS